MFESVRDINVASRLIEDMSGSTLDDPLYDRYVKLGCSISALEKDSDDYKMILKYLEKTYDPVRVGDIVSLIYFIFIARSNHTDYRRNHILIYWFILHSL